MFDNQLRLKQQAAQAALASIKLGCKLGVGSGSTVNAFIDALSPLKHRFSGVVAASVQTENYLKAIGFDVLDLNNMGSLDVYIDGADEVNQELQLIKGGGGALTREKVIASASKQFICIADQSKWVDWLGGCVLPIEVIPMARSYVAREIVKLGGFSSYRLGYLTDNGNNILDTQHWDFTAPQQLESLLNNIPGVVCNGLFAQRAADQLFLATTQGVRVHTARA